MPVRCRRFGCLGDIFFSRQRPGGSGRCRLRCCSRRPPRSLTHSLARSLARSLTIVQIQICAIAYGRIQGKQALIAKFENSSLMCEEKHYRPLIFYSSGPRKGEVEPFPIGPNVRPRRTDDEA